MNIGVRSATALRLAAALVMILLAAFFGFVGFNKVVDTIAELTRYGSWTIWIPNWLGRTVGWTELACALLLLVGLARRSVGRLGAVILIVNQIFAAAVHAAHWELGALPQNLILILLLVFVAVVARDQPSSSSTLQGASS